MKQTGIIASIFVAVVTGVLIYWFTEGASRYLTPEDNTPVHTESEEWWVATGKRNCIRAPTAEGGVTIDPAYLLNSRTCTVYPGSADILGTDAYLLDCESYDARIVYAKTLDKCIEIASKFN